MPTFRYTSLTPSTTESGRPLALGDEVDLSSEEQELPHNKLLLEEGHLLELPKPKSKSKSNQR